MEKLFATLQILLTSESKALESGISSWSWRRDLNP